MGEYGSNGLNIVNEHRQSAQQNNADPFAQYVQHQQQQMGYDHHQKHHKQSGVDTATEADSVDNLFGNYMPKHPTYDQPQHNGNYGAPRLSNLHDQEEKKPNNDASTIVSDQIAAAALLRQPILT